ncbi:unnamed protein product [Paramecium sonneborni]|uniref:Uncharacterized protein n=1 Tax=Paramecium sonneborni TaxID=65129 RepID=A0A8S1REH9_9CILI|nr:unnamed protein product [Paramecium sonneborni]
MFDFQRKLILILVMNKLQFNLIQRGYRYNIPVCNCQDQFYNDYQIVNCLQCDQQCKTCNSNGCSTCKGNRLLSSDEKTCDCLQIQQAIQILNGVQLVKLLSQILNLLMIYFKYYLICHLIQAILNLIVDKHYSFETQFSENSCFKFLVDETINKLGNNPDSILNQEDDLQMILKLSDNATIIPRDQIIFINSSIGYQDCLTKLSQFIFNQVKLPFNLLSTI